ncbi:MAG: hypothetical protein RO257_18435 [Candidatus Kapabacteria bacterium]|nr:hypothetical protein [Candidatus Kapabacteria bacterium]MDT3741471.1 hypothetical protein [Candidatus Kapabacteria bacterium]
MSKEPYEKGLYFPSVVLFLPILIPDGIESNIDDITILGVRI